jgi:pseudouridine-5'-phosphate glycosidase
VVAAHLALGLPSGILVANPVPEADALDGDEIDAAIDEAVRDAELAGIGRRELTPYLLGRVVELSGGRSLTANVALVRNNARLAARTAVALSR